MAKKKVLMDKDYEEFNKMMAECEAKPNAAQVTFYHDDGSIWYQAMRGGHGDKDFVRHRLTYPALPLSVMLESDAINRFRSVLHDETKSLEDVSTAYDTEIDKLCTDGESINMEDYDNAASLMYDFANHLLNYKGCDEYIIDLCSNATDMFRELAQSAPSVYDQYVAICLDMMSNVLMDQGKFNEAEKVRQEAFDICRTDAVKFGPIDWTALLTYMYEKMGTLYQEMGNEKKAIAYYEEGWRTFFTSGQCIMSNVINLLDNRLSELYEKCGMTHKLEKFKAEVDELRK